MFCRECGAEIPDGSKHCSECGAKLVNDTPIVQSKPVEKESFFKENKKLLLGCCIGLIVIFFLFALFSGGGNDSDTKVSDMVTDSIKDNLTESEFKDNCSEINYKELDKNSDKFFGDRVTVSGKVLQIMEDGNGGLIRLATDGGYDDVVAVLYTGSNNVVEDDYITVYGYVMTDYSYTSQANYKITIPCIEAKYIDK